MIGNILGNLSFALCISNVSFSPEQTIGETKTPNAGFIKSLYLPISIPRLHDSLLPPENIANFVNVPRPTLIRILRGPDVPSK